MRNKQDPSPLGMRARKRSGSQAAGPSSVNEEEEEFKEEHDDSATHETRERAGSSTCDDVPAILPVLIDWMADLLSWRDRNRSIVAIIAISVALYMGLIHRYSLVSLVAYLLLIRLIFVSARGVLCHHSALQFAFESMPESTSGDYSLVGAFEAWRKIEESEDTVLTLRTVAALWSLAILGRYLRDPQLILAGALVLFAVSFLFWTQEEEAVAAADLIDEVSAEAARPWYVLPRRSSLNDVLRDATIDLHQATKQHLLQMPSAKMSVAVIIPFCVTYTAMFNYVDTCVLLFFLRLNYRLLSITEKGKLWYKTKTGVVDLYNYGHETYDWLHAELHGSKESEETSAAAQETNAMMADAEMDKKADNHRKKEKEKETRRREAERRRAAEAPPEASDPSAFFEELMARPPSTGRNSQSPTKSPSAE